MRIRGWTGRKPKDIRNTFRKLLAYFGVRKIQLGMVVILTVFSTGFSIVGPNLRGKVTTRLFEGFIAKFAAIRLHQPLPALDLGYIQKMLLLIGGLYLISAAFGYIQQLIMSDVAQRIVYDIRADVNAKLHQQPLKYFDGRTHGEVMSRVTNDIDNIANTLQQSLTQFIRAFCTILGILIMMLSISPLLTLPTAMLETMRITKASQKHFGAQQKELGAMDGHVEEMYSGFKIIKSFDREEESLKTFEEINHRLGEAAGRPSSSQGL